MLWMLGALAVLVASGVLALALARRPVASTVVGVGGAVIGSLLGLSAAFSVWTEGTVLAFRQPWDVPYGTFALRLDALSAFFLVPILGLTGLAAIYGGQYLQAYAGQKALGACWFFYNLLTASMVLVVTASNGVLFLVAWEVMSLSSFFLVTFEDEKAQVREAGWTYLVATHLGTAFLLALFVLLGKHAGGTLDFAGIAAAGVPADADVLFVLALVGFGTKAGFLPLHVWLPEAHPAAPSHVSAVMSGVMIKTGIYGILRTLTFLGKPPEWWAWLMIAIGLTSGVLGILSALAQKDLKRMLAYSSVENIGIIALGLGTGLLGLSADKPALAVLGFAGALLHVVNHAIFKGMLFLGAGVILHETGTVALDRLGGLMKRMPGTATAFLIGAAAIAGMPPFNGFVSEFLIYLAAFETEITQSGLQAVPALAVIAGLALISGLAAAGFTKVFGVAFLGAPRSEQAAKAHAPSLLLSLPMLLLAVGCLAVGLGSFRLVPALAPVVNVVARLDGDLAGPHLLQAAQPLAAVVTTSALLIVLVLALAGLRRWLLRDRAVTDSDTWGCGYARPTTRMQYTASSFSQTFVELFSSLLPSRKHEPALTDYFPRGGTLATETPEPWSERLYRPLFLGVGRGLAKLRCLQQGQVQMYVLYIAITIVLLLAWYLGVSA